MGGRPIVHKYRKGKVKRTLKRESKELEVVDRESDCDQRWELFPMLVVWASLRVFSRYKGPPGQAP